MSSTRRAISATAACTGLTAASMPAPTAAPFPAAGGAALSSLSRRAARSSIALGSDCAASDGSPFHAIAFPSALFAVRKDSPRRRTCRPATARPKQQARPGRPPILRRAEAGPEKYPAARPPKALAAVQAQSRFQWFRKQAVRWNIRAAPRSRARETDCGELAAAEGGGSTATSVAFRSIVGARRRTRGNFAAADGGSSFSSAMPCPCRDFDCRAYCGPGMAATCQCAVPTSSTIEVSFGRSATRTVADPACSSGRATCADRQ